MTKFHKVMLERLMEEYNSYSELVALNYQQKCEESTLQWNRGSLYRVKENLEFVAKESKVKLVYTSGPHPFLERTLEYLTVKVEG